MRVGAVGREQRAVRGSPQGGKVQRQPDADHAPRYRISTNMLIPVFKLPRRANTVHMSADRVQQSGQITIDPARPDVPEDVDAAIRIGNTSLDTLGLMPPAAYQQYAEQGTLLLARQDGVVVGYALYSLPRRPPRIRLFHLCVDPAHRRHRIAHQLIERISAIHGDYPGILACCRQDYGLGPMWARLGFNQRSERPGRGKTPTVLVNWWLDHGLPDLLTAQIDDDDVRVRAAVDLNILRDMVDETRNDARDVKALIHYQLSDRLELVRTPALNAEISTIDGPLRTLCTKQVQRMQLADPAQGGSAAIRATLLAAAQAIDPSFPASRQDEFDLNHVVDAACAALNVFITRDQAMTRLFRSVTERRYGLRIMSPIDVLTHLDELMRAEAYRPVVLLGTAYRRQALGLDSAAELQRLADAAGGERTRDYQELLRTLVHANRERTGIFDSDGSLVAAYSAYPAGAELMVPLVRVANHPHAETLARQILFLLRQQAVAANTDVVRLADTHLSRVVKSAALADGFRVLEEGLYAYALNLCATAEQVSARATQAARNTGQTEPPLLRSTMPAIAVAELERTWWPVKIIDSLLPSYLIPIQQAFSADLLGIPETLIERDDTLGLSREHVYYRRPGGTAPKSPARLLWYMSSTGSPARPSAIVACSHLDAVVTGPPAELHSRFRHLGVWNERQVQEAAKDGIAQALVFSNTEILSHPIDRRTATRLSGQTFQPPLGPRLIKPGFFAAIYRAGKDMS